MWMVNANQQQHWCNNCGSEVQFDKGKDYRVRDERLTFKGETVIVLNAKIPVCPVCTTEIADESLDTLLMQSAIELWEQKTGRNFK